jgi:ethanolamine utilization cobalamin adenosyltransferase
MLNSVKEFFIDRDEKKLHIKYIKQLLNKSSKSFLNNKNERLLYIEEALRKAEIKKVEEYEEDDGDDVNGKPIIRRLYDCPTCKQHVYYKQNYCSHCGQRITFKG